MKVDKAGTDVAAKVKELGPGRLTAIGAWLRCGRSDAPVGPAPLELAEDSPEEPAVHQAGDPAAAARAKRLRLGVFEMVRDLVQEGLEQLFERPRAVDLVVRVDPDQPARPVVAAQHAAGGPGVDVDDEGDPAGVDLLQPVAKQRCQGRDRRLEAAEAR